MPLLGNSRTFARIRISEGPDKAFELIQQVLGKMKLKPKSIIAEKRFIHGKTKMSLLKNKFGEDFRIMARLEDNGSVIDIYYNGITLSGPDKGPLIKPFYEKLKKLLPNDPPMDVSCVDISDESILASATESVRSDNTSASANSVADEIAKLAKLKSDGQLSEDEFTRMKNDLINKM